MTEATSAVTLPGKSAGLIAVVDDHPIMRDAVEEIVRATHPDRKIVGFGTLAEVAEAGFYPCLLLLDLALAGSVGIDSLVSARARFPEAAIVVFSAEESRDTILSCLNAGASGYIVKTSNRALLVAALGVVLSGGVFVPPQSLPRGHQPGQGNGQALPAAGATRAHASGTPVVSLTQRQRDVLALLLRGLPNKLICRRLDLSENTVKTHIRAVFDALHVDNRTQAVIRASELGLQLATDLAIRSGNRF